MVQLIVKGFLHLVKLLRDFVSAPLVNLVNTTWDSFLESTNLDEVFAITYNDLSNIFWYISNFFYNLARYTNWVLSYLGFWDFYVKAFCVISMLIIFLPIAVHSIKIAIRWYIALKP